MEWSNSTKATKVPLFRNVLPYAQDQIRLEQIVFRHGDLPRVMECPDHQVIEVAEGTFLPLDALVATLYGSGEISRSVFRLLNDLAGLVLLHSKVTNPIITRGLLTTGAEAQGFCLNAVFQESGLLYAHIGWEARCRPSRFHVCLASFRRRPNRQLDKGRWMPSKEIGVSNVLANELHQSAPGNPSDLLSGPGLQFLKEKFS
jgi:hypothetical protein